MNYAAIVKFFYTGPRIPVLGLVDAAGFLGQRVAGEGIGAGAGAAADLLVFAPLVSAMGPTVGGNGP
jgi:hypothetical protein